MRVRRTCCAGRMSCSSRSTTSGRFVWTRAKSTPAELLAIVERERCQLLAPGWSCRCHRPSRRCSRSWRASSSGAGCTSSTTARRGPSATCARCRDCARTSEGAREAIRCQHRARRTSRWTSTSARCALPARPPGLRTVLDEPQPDWLRRHGALERGGGASGDERRAALARSTHARRRSGGELPSAGAGAALRKGPGCEVACELDLRLRRAGSRSADLCRSVAAHAGLRDPT